MGKKARLKAIKQLANNMAFINEETHEKHEMLGSEILAWGTIKEIDGKPIEPEKKYMYNSPVMIIQNNRRRMKRAFLRNGEQGITELLKQNLNVVQQNVNR